MRPPRLATFDYLGGRRYFVTCCTLARRQVFTEAHVVDAVTVQILRSAASYGFAVLAYVFMPDHVHLLVEGRREDADFRLFMRNWKKRTTQWMQTEAGGRLWQESYFERVLRGEEGTAEVIAYILDNPVRAGLVKSAMDYPFGWSIATHEEIGAS